MNPTSEQLTAYALGEGSATEREALAAYLDTHAEAAAEVAAIRDTAALLSCELASELATGLDPARRAVLTALTALEPPAPRIRFPHAIVWPGLLAAGLAVVVMSPASALKRRNDVGNRELEAAAVSEAKEKKYDHKGSLAIANSITEDKAQGFATSVTAAPAPAAATPMPAMTLSTPPSEALTEPSAVASEEAETQPLGIRKEAVVERPVFTDHAGNMAPRQLVKKAAAPAAAGASARQDSDAISAQKTAKDDLAENFVAPGEAYPAFAAAGWHRVSTAADDSNRWSTLGADVDTASYANVRRFLANGQLPPTDAVRTEELLNSFHYTYQPPRGRSVPFAVLPEVGTAPWASDHRLVRIALKGFELDRTTRPPANLVFLVDVSGSMNEPTKLPLVQRALALLAQQLRPDDRVAIVTYAGEAGVRLEPTSVDNLPRILAAIESLSAGGGTNGAGGISVAYQLAKRDFIRGGVNRVVLCTDGDFNVGVSSRDELERMITAEARSNVFLSALGFGMGNYHDTTLQILADKGNGNYAYIDSEAEARKQIVDGGTGMLVTIAKDVKLQVEFNPRRVGAWRLLGYEKRHLEHQDFTDDHKDGGEIGAGHSMTALYEIIPSARSGALPTAKYANESITDLTEATTDSGELLTVTLRWKLPEGATSTAIAVPVSDQHNEPTNDFRFATAVAEFAQSLRGAEGTWSLERALRTAQETAGEDNGRREFIDVIRKTQQLRR